MDIAIPDNNEAEFFSVAKRLGTSELRFLYPSASLAAQKKHEHPDWNVGVLSSQPNEIRKAKHRELFSATSSNEIAILESSPDIIFGVERIPPKDGLHARHSGLNHVLCALMARKGTALGLSFNLLLNAPPPTRQVLIGRMRQNALLARKNKLTALPLSCAHSPFELRSREDLQAWLCSL